MSKPRSYRVGRCAIPMLLVALGTLATPAGAAAGNPLPPMELYAQLRAFRLSNETLHADHIAMKRDRIALEWTGDFHLEAPVGGKIYGAVFNGQGHLTVEPMNSFEKDNVQRFLKSDRVDVTFSTAVLRFSDDTPELLAKLARGGGDATAAQKLASELEDHLLRETGLNLSARLLAAIANGDQPGVFFGEFSGGNRGRFSALMDHQTRSLRTVFGIDGGEKGMLFQYQGELRGNDVWTAFYSEEDFKQGRVAYASNFDLVTIPDYRMEIDLRDANDWLRAVYEPDLVALQDGVRIIPMALSEDLDESYKQRLKKNTKVRSANLSGGTKVDVIQEPWEGGLSLVLPRTLSRGEKITVKMEADAEHPFMTWSDNFHYPLSTETWYPRHGDLQRSRFDLKFLHKQKTLVISVGQRAHEEKAGDGGKGMFTEWVMNDPVGLVCFAVGPFERHSDKVSVEGHDVPIEFYSVPSSYLPVKEDFIVAELMNGVNYFSHLFGGYPYQRLGGVFFPAGFGQGLPTLLLLPVSGRASLRDFSFQSHEISHQWWGDLVGWRSYRDQWLSEGFAEYSAALYSARRENPKRALDLVKSMRRELQEPPGTDTGVASGKLYEVGPLIMGRRLSSRRSFGAYQALVYSKGALTLRMLHFLFTDPDTGNDDAFYKMLKDFVQANREGWATTESFMSLASERFAQTAIGRKYGLKDLNWFLKQWVYGAAMPSYRLQYDFQPRPEGGVLLTGTLYQEGVPDDWFMPLPLTLDFGGDKIARGTIHAQGPQTPVKIGLPMEPKRVLLDPDLWVLTIKTSEARGKH